MSCSKEVAAGEGLGYGGADRYGGQQGCMRGHTTQLPVRDWAAVGATVLNFQCLHLAGECR